MNIDRSLRLPGDQYHHGKHKKSLIVWHHTVGGSAKSTYQWWLDDPRTIATAYIIGRDGTIYEVFPPECWAYHLKVGDPGTDKRSIGIELASYGALTAVERDGVTMLYAFDGKYRLGIAKDIQAQGGAVQFAQGFRGYTWFATYTDAQVNAGIALTVVLCQQFGIPARIPAEIDWRGDADLRQWIHYKGVLHHALLRKDKSDLHPGFAYNRLERALTDLRDSLGGTE